MPLNQSFRQVFVTNSPALLADGSTVENIGVGQVGFVDAKTYIGVTSPTYAKNKGLQIVQGTPDLSYLPLMAGVPNENVYSHLIKGKLIKNFRGKAAKRGRNQIITVGNSGDVSDTDTISAKAGDQKLFYLKLTGPAIDKLYSTQGITRQYFVDGGCVDDCTDTCAVVADPRPLAESLALQINTDRYINKFIKASVITQCTPSLDAAATVNCYRFEVRVCDTRDDIALGIVQGQYPDDKVTRTGVEGSSSVYQVVRDANTTPSAVSNAGFVLIPDCPTCPSGYTEVTSGNVYTVSKQDAGDAGALTSVKSAYGISTSTESGARINYQYGQSTYVLVSDATLTVAGTDTLVFVGQTRNSCVLTTPTTTAWTLAETQVKYPKTYKLTIADSICGTDRLADIQAALPALEVTLVNGSGSCVHSYETTTYSQCVSVGCSEDTLVFTAPQPFEGSEWVAGTDTALPTNTTCLVGVKIEVAFINRITGECTYDYFPYESDTIHIQASNYDPNYNNSPEACTNYWPVKEIQSFQHPAGFGAHVRKMEEKSKSYDLRERSFDPVVREIEGYSFQANPVAYYDEYILEFEFEYKVGGWSEKYTDSYSVSIFVPEGQGKSVENAINSYVSSVGIDIDPVVL